MTATRRLHEFLGTRRSVMLAIAVSAIFRGLTVFHDTGAWYAGQSILFYDLPPAARLAGWAGSAVIAILVAIFARPSREWIGWWALAVMPAERIFSYTVSFTAWWLPGGREGSPWSAAYAAQWVGALVMLALIARWREDSQLRLRFTRDEASHG